MWKKPPHTGGYVSISFLGGERQRQRENTGGITKPAIYQATPVTMPGTQSVKQPADLATNANGICEDWTVSDLVMFIHELKKKMRDCNAVCITANIAHRWLQGMGAHELLQPGRSLCFVVRHPRVGMQLVPKLQ